MGRFFNPTSLPTRAYTKVIFTFDRYIKVGDIQSRSKDSAYAVTYLGNYRVISLICGDKQSALYHNMFVKTNCKNTQGVKVKHAYCIYGDESSRNVADILFDVANLKSQMSELTSNVIWLRLIIGI